MIELLLTFYAVMSLLSLIAYARDKRKAKKQRWRIPEAVLLSLGFFGGAVGSLLGMKLFRHKTRHWYFWAVNLFGLAWQAVLFYFVYTH